MKGKEAIVTYIDKPTKNWLEKYVADNDTDIAKLLRKLLAQFKKEESAK